MLNLGIIGATGYVGAEIVRLLALRDDVKITTVVSNSFVGQPFSSVYPSLRGIYDKVCDKLDIDVVAQKADFFITALPHGVSTTVIPGLLEKGKRVIDHSGDFRFRDIKTYEKWYKVTHGAPELIDKAVYGLPELYRDEIKTASLVADPGCYPTCSVMGIAPALKNKVVSHQDIVINAVSGVSGAGRKSDLPYAFCETDENFKAYGVANHRHTPEIEQELSLLCGEPVMVSFTPHLAPMKRGMLATCYLNLINQELSPADIHSIYEDYYKGEPFVRILPLGQLPETKYVAGSNYIDIGIAVDTRMNKLIVVSALDNLGKGSASQAIQALNIMAGIDETKGLLSPGLYL
ncbi:MAG: N-acetyl-gamma-glutamyl-phosphate reductase [Acetivibrionales bacterium]|jgi:N-acetyl-gamma-glutamyl-phosphate reductase|nr:N-acetyl-gamma-glutamyl-phosphate reductase [Clostridiaceae bacterium]